MRRIIRGFLWVIKGMLLVIARAALGLWPWSYGHGRLVALSRYALQPDHVERVGFVIACGDGQMGIGVWNDQFADAWLESGRDQAALFGLREMSSNVGGKLGDSKRAYHADNVDYAMRRDAGWLSDDERQALGAGRLVNCLADYFGFLATEPHSGH